MYADLNAFLRLHRQEAADRLAPDCAGLRALAMDMQEHLAKASVLIADLAPARRLR